MARKEKWSVKLWGMRKHLRAWAVAMVLILLMQVNALATVGNTPVGGATYRFVQLKNGETIEAQAMPGYYRSDAVVARFVSDLVTLGYRWDTSKQYVEDRKILFPATYAAVGHLFDQPTLLKWGIDFATKYGKVQGGTQTLQNSYALLTSDPVVEDQGNGLWFVEVRAIRFATDGKEKILGQEKLHFKFAVKAINPNTQSYWTLADQALNPYMERFWSDGLAVVDFVDMHG
ncbi:hypothetical protein [Acaryochloris marina]|uniref:Uncharacterized protein n=1 Tax=Acaryochloris marina (strain MBIC 11017) TaxID=329726 RepID=A8ZLH2_ACAM1|nr:hypothetical protein [Acaryochloris marina]ABW31999.1 hypothetical protein AM1_B0280 [Acaryochloris marina MBIC11017]